MRRAALVWMPVTGMVAPSLLRLCGNHSVAKASAERALGVSNHDESAPAHGRPSHLAAAIARGATSRASPAIAEAPLPMSYHAMSGDSRCDQNVERPATGRPLPSPANSIHRPHLAATARGLIAKIAISSPKFRPSSFMRTLFPLAAL